MFRICISTYICVMMLTYRYMHTYVMIYVYLCSLYMRHVWHVYPYKTSVYIFIHIILVFKRNMIKKKISLNIQFWFMLYIYLSSAQQCACEYHIFVMHCATMSQKCACVARCATNHTTPATKVLFLRRCSLAVQIRLNMQLGLLQCAQ